MNVQHLRHMVTTLHQPRSMAALVLSLGTLAAILALVIARIALTPADTSAPAHRATLTGAHTAPITAAASSAYDGQPAAAMGQTVPQLRSTNPIQTASIPRMMSSCSCDQMRQPSRSPGVKQASRIVIGSICA